jgi:hypothetical protein
MKKSFFKTMAIILSILLISTLFGCGDVYNAPNGKTYDTYGLLNKESNYNPKLQYRIIIGNVVWAVILSGTIAAPIYFLGFSLWEPIGYKTDDWEPGLKSNFDSNGPLGGNPFDGNKFGNMKIYTCNNCH